ncbi:N-6 DNA Methylase [Blastococcus aggregatus]|uniref:site-specific DNA-methyltransferase (adenine-specific) n=1 Tax=Blastococcus aggregatus TaxID=38502 RepID=A0A285V138_9ACTN|nr:type ISP restriction/modification enzyme [Blastococcus aggregatus]SOC47824.1 N-6 DNA Methylase [Blastococcus aggregatus]
MTVPGRLAADVAAAVSTFGAAVAPRLASGAGEPEDQIRGPLENLLDTAAAALGVRFSAVGEASLADLRVRPDYATLVNDAITGYVEVKRPGRGADPTRWPAGSHDGIQWAKLRALPNVLYTDGQQWALYRTGERIGEIATLTGDIHTAGAALTASDEGLARLLSEFLLWQPVAPRSISQLVNSVAPLTRLLREEVTDTLTREQRVGDGPFSRVATDWRALLFPDADDAAFADQYAQAVTFALLLARTEDIEFAGKSVDAIARELGRTHSLLGKALSVLTDETIGVLTVTLDTLVRVIAVVDFGRFAHHRADPYLHLYEHFLAEYDPALRRLTGSYYTPAAVVSGMTRLTDEVLRTRLGRSAGLADPTVTIVDPAMGTGAYVLDVLETVADNARSEQGPGAVPAQLKDAAARIVGVEKQAGPFAVAELRVAEALHRHGAVAPAGGVRLYVADTLDNPFAEQARLAATLDPIAISRRYANKMKAEEPVVVVLGNPPYRERAKGQGGFIEDGAPNTAQWATPPLAAFREPGNGLAEYVLSNLYVYFWRWATWKVFDAHPDSGDGVICFITTSGYLKGPGFAGMRRYLRAHASEGWIIDGTPEGHQPDVNTRIFGGVQQPVAIGLFVRRSDNDPEVPAPVHYRALHGRQSEKFDALKAISVDEPDGWEDCPTGWTAPFLPAGGDEWAASPALEDLFPWQSPGVKPNRTWVYAPLPNTLIQRWRTLVTAPDDEKPDLFRESRDASLTRSKPGLPGFEHPAGPVANESGPCLPPVQVAYRSFDLQYVIPDDRVLSTPRTDLWRVRGEHQLYVTELHSEAIRPGPALTFAAHTPDMHHFKGSGGGRVLPLHASADRSRPNVAPGLLDLLAEHLDVEVGPEDLIAYVAAVTAHPGFAARFAEDLRTPGIRVPLTADPDVWSAAVTLGRRILWLHTRGERMADPSAGRPAGLPRIADESARPKVLTAVPDSPDGMPDELGYDPATRVLSVGEGRIGPVAPEVWAYEVSGMNVLRKWFGYRRATRPRTRGEQSPLDDIRPTSWPAAYTSDLLQLLEVLTLVTQAEPEQAELLERVMSGASITVADLTDAGVLPVPSDRRNLPRPTAASTTPEQILMPEA